MLLSPVICWVNPTTVHSKIENKMSITGIKLIRKFIWDCLSKGMLYRLSTKTLLDDYLEKHQLINTV